VRGEHTHTSVEQTLSATMFQAASLDIV